MALNSLYCVDVPLHAASGLFMFTLPPKRGTTRKQKLIKKGELQVQHCYNGDDTFLRRMVILTPVKSKPFSDCSKMC